MKHYYKFSINYDDDFAIHSVNQELKKGDVVVIPVYADEFAIGIVAEPISELKALTECGEVEDVITVVNTKHIQISRKHVSSVSNYTCL